MSKVKLRNVNPIGPTDLPEIGRVGFGHDENGKPTEAGDGCLAADEVFEVDEELAGEAPFWRPAEDRDRETDGRILVRHRTDEDGNVEVLDPGNGLLALVGIFELADPDDGLGGKTLAELKDFAAAQEPAIDLGDAKTKSAILAVIRKAI